MSERERESGWKGERETEEGLCALWLKGQCLNVLLLYYDSIVCLLHLQCLSRKDE